MDYECRKMCIDLFGRKSKYELIVRHFCRPRNVSAESGGGDACSVGLVGAWVRSICGEGLTEDVHNLNERVRGPAFT